MKSAEADSPTDRASSWQPVAAWWAIVLLPPLLAFAVYWPYIDSNFVNDDWSYLRGVRDGNLLEVIGRSFQFAPFNEFGGPTPFLRPLPDVPYKIFYDWFGLQPEPHHIINITAHAATAVAAGVLVARLARSPLTGLATAVLFVTWPSYESTVTWMSQLGELFCALFGTLGLLAFHAYLVSERRNAPRYLALAAISMLLAALSKQTATIAFAMLPVLAWAERERVRSNQELRIAAGVLGAVAAIAAGLWVYEQLYEPGVEHVVEYEVRKITRYEAYLRHVIWPFEGSTAFQRVLEIGYLGLGALFAIRGRRIHIFFFVWSLIALFPYAFIDGPEQPRYTYLAALPFLAVLVLTGRDVVNWAAQWPAGRAAQPVAALIVAAVALVAARQTRDEQAFIEAQARSSTFLVSAIRTQCGDMPPGSTIYVLGSSVLDPFGTNNRALVNMLYHEVYYRRVTEAQSVQSPNCFVDVRR